jgi:para-nitrobenzyl esterase
VVSKSAPDIKLADQISSYWTNFAKTGNPNSEGLPVWQAFDGANASVFRIGTDAEVKQRGVMPDFNLF